MMDLYYVEDDSNIAAIVKEYLGQKNIRVTIYNTITAAEYQLLLFLMQNKGRTLTRERIREQVWDVNGSYVNNNTLTVKWKQS